MARLRRTRAAHDFPEVSGSRSDRAADPDLRAVLERDRRDMENLRRLIAFSLSPDACCVDVGAHRGAVLHEIVRVAPQGRHLAYEPLPQLADGYAPRSRQSRYVRRHCRTDLANPPFSTFEAWRRAVADLSFARPLLATCPDVEQIDVRLERLDDALADTIRWPFIKVDVEGAEKQVFAGHLRR